MGKARALLALPQRDGGATGSSLARGKVDGDRPRWWQLPLCQGQQQRAGTKEDSQELELKNLFPFDF